MIKDEEQCRFIGFIYINKAPGDFHFGYHNSANILQKIFDQNLDLYTKLQMDYKINYLTFGDKIDKHNKRLAQ